MTSAPGPKSQLTHLQRLEAESIHILREVVAETVKPVMLSSSESFCSGNHPPAGCPAKVWRVTAAWMP